MPSNNTELGLNLGLTGIPKQAIRTPGTSAAECFETLKNEITTFQDNLDDGHDVCIMLASFGQSIVMEVTAIGFRNSGTLCFQGFVNGSPAQLIQYYTQLNFMLLSVPKPEPEKKPNRIGFFSED